jgi:hypothetical protein
MSKIIMQTNSGCPARGPVIEALEAGNAIKARTIIGREKEMGRFPVYIDKEDKANRIAFVKEVTDDKGNAMSEAEIADLVQNPDNYSLTLTGIDSNIFYGELKELERKKTLSGNASIPTEIQELMDAKVKEGIIDTEGAEARVKVMLENLCDTALIKRVVSKWRRHKKPAHKLRVLYKDPYLESSKKKGEQGKIADGLRYAMDRYAVIEEGEKSVGKNVFVETLAWLMLDPLYLITFSRQMSPSSIYGEKSTDNSAAEYFKTEMAKAAAEARQNLTEIEESIAQTRRYYEAMCEKSKSISFTEDEYASLVDECVKSGDFSLLLLGGGKFEIARRRGEEEHQKMREALDALLAKRDEMKKSVADLELKAAQAQSVNIIIDQSELYDWLVDGGLMVFNEMNMAESNFFASFSNQLLDGTGFLFIPGRGEVPINPDCVLCGTQNADYEGVEQQNEATMSRFNCMVFEQPETIKEQLKVAVKSELKKNGYEATDVDNKLLVQCEQFYKHCRGAVKNGDLSNAVLNIRGFVRAVTTVIESDGYKTLKRAVQESVINTCPVDERESLFSIAQTIFDM